jgi:Protein of unknown function (DUF2911)
MKKIILMMALAISLQSTFAQQQPAQGPPPSTSTTIKQQFGLSDVGISYSRPNVKGRKIFGELVPFAKVWRTGANAATTLTFGSDVTIGGKKITKGKYGLLTIPGEKEWTVIITRQTDVTNADAYKQSEDVLRFKVEPVSLDFDVETFSIIFMNVKASSMDLMILWDRTLIQFPVTNDIKG